MPHQAVAYTRTRAERHELLSPHRFRPAGAPVVGLVKLSAQATSRSGFTVPASPAIVGAGSGEIAPNRDSVPDLEMLMVLKKAIAVIAGWISGGGKRVDSGSVTGSVYVGDDSYELQHAYAYASRGDEELWVYLTDAPLSEKQVTKRFGVHDAARAGQVHGVKLRLDPADSDPKSLSAVLLMPPAAENASLVSISSSGSASRFEQLSLPPVPLTGRVSYEQEAIFESPPYGFDAEFEFADSPQS